MSPADLFDDRIDQRRCDPRLAEIILDRITIMNGPIAYLLSAVIVFGLGFAAAARF